jgi:hypothetical protein
MEGMKEGNKGKKEMTCRTRSIASHFFKDLGCMTNPPLDMLASSSSTLEEPPPTFKLTDWLTASLKVGRGNAHVKEKRHEGRQTGRKKGRKKYVKGQRSWTCTG